ncbi:substrate-binding periplasmic protein [Fluviispira sanaruensis]|uniref:Amino acid ABC transporter substrate-binding protein n=1 Tax=Fluviispira sanaruensis TaxID=2493639 RepID=A0A4P2W020_FLUSA|nr:ABC transporter substrate-binding protein [Fluviispira sanaruensis]BBH54492.1 amino acid ABC transporter substrate-binding protein [Fluviispira sanaruensis]
MRIFTLLILLLLINNSYGKNLTIKLSTLDLYPYVGQSTRKNGIVQNIIESAFDVINYDMETNFMPWDNALNETMIGNYDAVFPVSLTEERKKYFYYSEPVYYHHLVFLISIHSNIIYNKYDNLNKTYDELKKYRFGVVRAYANEKNFDQRTDLTKIISNNDTSNLLKLKNKTVDIVYIDKYVATFLIYKMNDQFKDQFKFLEPELANEALYIAFSKKAKDALNKRDSFNAGLKKIKESGLYDKILSNFQKTTSQPN